MDYRQILSCCFVAVLLTGSVASAQVAEDYNPKVTEQEALGSDRTIQTDLHRFGSVINNVSSGNYFSITEEQAWQLYENPTPELNFNFMSVGYYAGDVTGNDQADMILSATARDERTGALEDLVGKTVLFEGGNYSSSHDQLKYDQLIPVGDMNGNGYNDAFATDEDRTEFHFFTGSDDGYTDTGESHNIETGPLYRSFGDINGNGYDDIVTYSQNTLDFKIIFGAEDPEDITATTISTDFPVFSVALVETVDDGTMEVAVLSREANVQDWLTIYQIDADGEEEVLQESEMEESSGFPNMLAANFTDNPVPELVISYGSDGVGFLQYNMDMGAYPTSGMLKTSPGHIAGDIDGSGQKDMIFEDEDDIYIAYNPDNLSDWEGELPKDEALSFPVDNVSISGATYPAYPGYGDISGNGIDDYIFSFRDDDEFGRVYLIGDEDQNYDYEIASIDIDTYSGDRVQGTVNLGDINDNGYDDVAFQHYTAGKERVAIYYGGESISDSPDIEIETPFHLVSAIETGDFNGDGDIDIAFAVGSNRQSADQNVEYNGVHIVYGTDLDGVDLLAGDADHIIRFDQLDADIEISGAYISNIRNVGDINGNGADDLLYAAPMARTDEEPLDEKVYITHGGSSISSEPDIRIPGVDGSRLSALGDVTGNGNPDFAVSSFLLDNENTVAVFFGEEGADYTEPDLILEHDYMEGSAIFGISLAAGDFNGNGINDIVTKPFTVNEEGRDPQIHIYYGGEDLDEEPDQIVDIPFDALNPGEMPDQLNSLGSLEMVPGVFGERDGLMYATSGSPFTNALIMQISEGQSDPVQKYVLEAPNQDANLGAHNNFINVDAYNAIGNFTSAGSYDVILPQVDDGNDMAGSSRVYRFSIPDALVLHDVSDRPEDHGGWVILEYGGALIEAKQNGNQLFNELDVQRKDDGEWISTGKIIKYDEDLADRIEVAVPVTKPTGEDPSDENTFTFRLTAYDSEAGIVARSNTESGYAKDNIPPGQVAGFTADEEEEQIVFSWEPLDDPNMDGYLLFKVDENGDIDLDDPEAFTSETTLAIDKPEEGNPSYAVAGLDQHNNIGEPSQTLNVPVSAPVEADIPEKFALNNNYPNPFNPDTQISYDLPEEARVTLEVYNVLGQHVQTLVDETQNAGRYEVRFDASNLSSGTYIYRIVAGDFVDSRQMMLVK